MLTRYYSYIHSPLQMPADMVSTVKYTVCDICLLTWYYSYTHSLLHIPADMVSMVKYTACHICMLTWYYSYIHSLSHLYADMVLQLHSLWYLYADMVLQLHTQSVTSVCWHGTTVTHAVCHICMLTRYYSYTRSLSHLYADKVSTVTCFSAQTAKLSGLCLFMLSLHQSILLPLSFFPTKPSSSPVCLSLSIPPPNSL